MLFFSFVVVLAFKVEAVVRNATCPEVTPIELDWKEMDGTWYLAAVATDLHVQGDCAMVIFDHQDTLGVSIKWITNNTASFYNGSVALIPDPNSNSTGDLLQVTYNDQKSETYSFLDISYEHYAVVFACYDNEDGNSSTYAVKLDKAIANYSLQDTPFIAFNNTEDTFWVRSSGQLDTSSLVMTRNLKMTRSPHLKSTDAVKLDKAIANYSLQDTPFIAFNNTEDTCWVRSSGQLDTASLVMTSAAALALFRRLY